MLLWTKWGTCAFVAIALSCSACAKEDDDDNDDSTEDPDKGYWYVGKDGAMFRVDESGQSTSTYELESDADLLSIACRGAEEAWVVGELGTVLFTFDGGSSWTALDQQTDETFTAVAVDGDEGVWIAGTLGSVLHTSNAGSDWTRLPTENRPWTGLATSAAGDSALLTDAGGAIWQHDGATLQQRFLGPEPLSNVWMTPDGSVAVAVGASGTMVESRDGGESWSAIALATTRDLHAVYVTHHGDSIFAVGEAGVVVRLGAHGNTIEELLPPDLALRDLHLSAQGAGHVLGDAGTALLSWDVGETWDPIELDTAADLTALDQLHAEPHL